MLDHLIREALVSRQVSLPVDLVVPSRGLRGHRQDVVHERPQEALAEALVVLVLELGSEEHRRTRICRGDPRRRRLARRAQPRIRALRSRGPSPRRSSPGCPRMSARRWSPGPSRSASCARAPRCPRGRASSSAGGMHTMTTRSDWSTLVPRASSASSWAMRSSIVPPGPGLTSSCRLCIDVLAARLMVQTKRAWRRSR